MEPSNDLDVESQIMIYKSTIGAVLNSMGEFNFDFWIGKKDKLLYMFKFNDNRNTNKQIELSDKQLKSIENRKKLALMYRAKDKIEDYQDKVFSIIDEKGLDNEDNKISLDTAKDVLQFIIPVKKQSEVVVITRKIEDLIQEDIEEAEIIDKKEQSGKID